MIYFFAMEVLLSLFSLHSCSFCKFVASVEVEVEEIKVDGEQNEVSNAEQRNLKKNCYFE